MGIDFYLIISCKFRFEYSLINYRNNKEKPTTDYILVIIKFAVKIWELRNVPVELKTGVFGI